ncbi:dihydrolipoamide acetyltransferase family protein [Anoxybacteroides amylolyticum]|uniref:Dihydrolipoamide acetyltransferase component of pyruvate dehydrogenase complex n=1 Tax=Anoxybacteroides amylolyticum TaxID=294699 RepID=A0A160F4E6_9BACL|nr:dihydrolipoamide acetyltransferase family protein [Anoxybacillus amylolyticus]ANB61309.1 e3 binding domain protein [Anoxybacillus amylolyticus]
MVEVKLHDIGEGMTEAVVVHYLVKKGEHVKADQPLVEVQTDKMVAEIPAPAAGTVDDIFIPEGQTVVVGTTLLSLRTENQQRVKEQLAAIVEREGERHFIQEPARRQRILASPYTRKIAREHGVDLALVNGTGPAGRITDDDVYCYLKAQQWQPVAEKPVQPQRTVTKTNENHEGIIPFRGRRKQIAKKMVQSLMTIAHCTHFEEIDVTELLAVREALKKQDVAISATAFFIKALSLALKQFPIFNARLDEENECIHLQTEHHFGIAVDTEEGLVVPVIKHVETKSLRQIHEEMKALTKKALENTLTISDMTGGTFTISNVGPLGGSIGATPIINYPEVALVAFHKTKKRPVVTENDEIAIRAMMNISMSFDHRVADGATAVAFTNYFAKLIENPNLMWMELI